jgi:hypothetical protein
MNCSERYNDCTKLISYLYLLKSVLLDLNDGIPLNKQIYLRLDSIERPSDRNHF